MQLSFATQSNFFLAMRDGPYMTPFILKFVTPAERHNGEEEAILAQRRKVYELAKEQHPERWSGNTRNWDATGEVWLNPPKELRTEDQQFLKAA